MNSDHPRPELIGCRAMFIDESSELVAAWPNGRTGPGNATDDGGPGIILNRLAEKKS